MVLPRLWQDFKFYLYKSIIPPPQDARIFWHCVEFKRVILKQNRTFYDPRAGEISTELYEAESNNREIRKLVYVFAGDRIVLYEEPERANKYIRVLNDFFLIKKNLISEISITIEDNPTFQSNINLRPTSYAAKAGQGNQTPNVMSVQSEVRNELCNTIVLNSDTLFREDNIKLSGPT